MLSKPFVVLLIICITSNMIYGGYILRGDVLFAIHNSTLLPYGRKIINVKGNCPEKKFYSNLLRMCVKQYGVQ